MANQIIDFKNHKSNGIDRTFRSSKQKTVGIASQIKRLIFKIDKSNVLVFETKHRWCYHSQLK